MRTVLSVLASLLAGLLAVLTVAGALVDEVSHRPDTVRGIAQRLAEDDAVRAAVPRAVTDSVEGVVPDAVPEPLAQLAEDLVRPLADSVAQDPDVAVGWADTADEARRAWLIDLDRARDTAEPVPGGTFEVPFGPVAQSGVTAAVGDLETRLRRNELDLPGQGLVEGLIGVDVGDWVADSLVAPLYDRAAQLRDSSELTMTVHVEALAGTDRATTARWVDASAHWIWAALGSAAALVAAVVLAPRRRRGWAFVVAGAVVLAGALLLRSRLAVERISLTAPEGASTGVAELVRRVEDAVRPALADVLAPWLDGLALGGACAVAVGVGVLLTEMLVTRVRRRGRLRAAGSSAV